MYGRENRSRMLEILHDPDKKIDEARDVLSKAFRTILRESRFSVIDWNNSMPRYLEDPRNRIPQNGKDMSSARGNLSKELSRNTMTWNVFMKGLSFINPISAKLTLEIEFERDKIVLPMTIYRRRPGQQPLKPSPYQMINAPVIDPQNDRLNEQLEKIRRSGIGDKLSS